MMQSVQKNKKNMLIPILIALPSIGLGLVWNMNSTVVPLLIGTATHSAQKLGILIAMAPITGLFTPYLAGVISDRTNIKIGKRKPWVLFGALLGCLCLFLLGISKTYIAMFILAFCVYGAINFYQGAYYSWMPEAVEPNQIGVVNGWGKLFYSLGGLIVFFVGVFLFNISPILPFILVIIFVIGPVLIATFTVKEDPTKFTKPSKLSLDFLKNKSAMRVFLTGFFFYIGYGLIMPFWIPYYEKMNHFSSSQISLALTAFTIIGLVCSVFIGIWCDKGNKQIILLISCIIYGIAFVVGMMVTNIQMLWAFTILSGLGFAMLQVVFYALIPLVAPKEKLGEYMGVNNIFLCIPQIIGNLLGGYLLSNGHGKLLFPISIGAIIIACLIIGVGKLKTVNEV